MLKMKLLLGLAPLLAALVVIAAPASAEFQSNGTTGQGKIKVFPETSTFNTNQTGPAIECKNSTAPEGEWHIQVKTEDSQGAQEVTTKGPHLGLKLTKWGHCTGPTGIAVTVECSLQVEQGTQLGSTGSVGAAGCFVLVGPQGGNHCIIKVTHAANKELSEVKLANGGQNEVEIASNVSGITSTLEETGTECKILTIEAGKEGHFKTKNALIVTGLKLV